MKVSIVMPRIVSQDQRIWSKITRYLILSPSQNIKTHSILFIAIYSLKTAIQAVVYLIFPSTVETSGNSSDTSRMIQRLSSRNRQFFQSLMIISMIELNGSVYQEQTHDTYRSQIQSLAVLTLAEQGPSVFLL